MLPVLPYPELIPAVGACALAAAAVLADADVHIPLPPVAACRRALHAAREHTAHAAVTVALTVACVTAPAGGERP